MDGVDGPAGQASDHRPVHPDVLEIVAGMLLDQLHRARRPESADAVLDERGETAVVAMPYGPGERPVEPT